MNQNVLELLKPWGWNEIFAGHFASYDKQGYSVGRVALEHKRIYRVFTQHGELLAEISGKMNYAATGREDYPAVGDWVVISPRVEERKATIHAILPRTSKFSRKVAGETVQEQIIASNVDTVFLVNALNSDFNLRRMERYLILAWESGATPVIVLNKSDLCDEVDSRMAEVQSVAIGVAIHAVSAERSEGLKALAPYLREGETVALMGSSGVGKSTLINKLMCRDMQRISEVRQGDDRGRHTTTHRELFRLPNGGLMIDTPGMRELQLWEGDQGLRGAFDDIECLKAECRFHDCRHVHEPGCALQAALENGTLEHSRYHSYLKLQRELAHLARKENVRLQMAEKEKWKKIHKELRKKKPRR